MRKPLSRSEREAAEYEALVEAERLARQVRTGIMTRYLERCAAVNPNGTLRPQVRKFARIWNVPKF